MPNDFTQIAWDAALEDDTRQIIRLAVREDLERQLDWTTVALVEPETLGTADVVARRAGVVAGLPAARLVLEEIDSRLTCTTRVEDGQKIAAGQTLATLAGPARLLLTAERPLLNMLSRLSGIASLAARYVEAAGSGARVYDTRKTTPGWRRLEKYAARMGGATNHRTGLFDAVLIKDNHLALVGAGPMAGTASTAAPSSGRAMSPGQAVTRAREFLRAAAAASMPGAGKPPGAMSAATESGGAEHARGAGQGGATDQGTAAMRSSSATVHASAAGQGSLAGQGRAAMLVEVEVDTLDQLRDALTAEPDIVLLDNMSLDQLRAAVALRNASGKQTELEASGGVTLDTIGQIARTGVERISVGAITHAACWLDSGLDWRS